MAKEPMTIEDVLAEIENLRKSPYVKLARDTANRALKQKLYNLRSLDKRGRKIAETMGLTFDESIDGGEE